MHYFAQDGNYGDAAMLVVVDTKHFTEQDWDSIDMASDWEKAQIALEISNRISGR